MPEMRSVLKSARRLRRGEAGFADAAGAAPGGAVVGLGGEDLRQVGQVGVMFPEGDPGGVGADGGQFQLASGRADGCQCCGVGLSGG